MKTLEDQVKLTVEKLLARGETLVVELPAPRVQDMRRANARNMDADRAYWARFAK